MSTSEKQDRQRADHIIGLHFHDGIITRGPDGLLRHVSAEAFRAALVAAFAGARDDVEKRLEESEQAR